MSKEKKEKVIKVENLVIHAQNVDFIRDRHREREDREREMQARDPWEFFLGRPRPPHTVDEEESTGRPE
ncbi:hypothetical protein J6TS1_11150 [Siminovitchia terrae]|uniref:Uncharacterized protein n=1 Tax=Siminovitchia terrae TaxID=1914933 RepID=A0A429X5H0_SIMTE|nr:hypothetical protein [Siminovitchia terrae]RST58541.1 hypothetical protein D5F11_017100 [Siminovitchia terrae]GIN89180.1 hypothetical protein J22TS1_02310 [Siminovitchia terrae]GIN95245.1 hypothetical protein J6TS1_11150 [Siminovitchia terrae]